MNFKYANKNHDSLRAFLNVQHFQNFLDCLKCLWFCLYFYFGVLISKNNSLENLISRDSRSFYFTVFECS